MATRTRQDWKLDEQGEYPRQIGWKLGKNGKRVQHKFRLGSDLKEAVRREQKLRELWERIEAIVAPPLWDDFTLDIAKQIAKGQAQISVRREDSDSPAEYARRVNRVQGHFPTIPFVAEDQQAYFQGALENTLTTESEIETVRSIHVESGDITGHELSELVPNDGRLHEAMRAYIAWIKEEYFRPELGRITANGGTKIRQVETLIERHTDAPLSQLDEDAVEEMIRFWRRHPFKKGTTTAITKKSAENYISELIRFLKWLNKSKRYKWRKPDNFDESNTRVDPDPQEQQKRLLQVDTFSLDELRLLNKYATPLERVFFLLGINCGFGTAEIASLLIGEVCLFQGHDKRHQEILGFETTNVDSFIKRVRRKNGVYGEFLLFPQTVEAMEWALKQRRKHPNPHSNGVLLLNDHGQPYDTPTKGENRNQQIPNRLADLIRRIRLDEKDFPKLSFGKLRKTAGDLTRRMSNGEVHGVFMCHGQPVATDDLTDVYSNRPFGKVFDAIRLVQDYLQPVFDAAGPTPFKPQPQAYTSPRTRDKMLLLQAEGKSIREIADAVKKSRMTVYRHLKRLQQDD